MGLLDNGNDKQYYQGNNFGNYQFISLDYIITQFEIAYVGENKIIPKIKRADVAFHAQRALAELSFDTFKSIKAQQIDLPPTLVMPLPRDYINYTKISTVDSSGIKHPLYPTRHTSNPFHVRQDDLGNYDFSFETSDIGILENSDFSVTPLKDSWIVEAHTSSLSNLFAGGMAIENGVLKTAFHTKNGGGGYNNAAVYVAYQEVDVSGVNFLDISATGTADSKVLSASPNTNTAVNPGVLRFGLSTTQPSSSMLDNRNHTQSGASPYSPNIDATLFDLQTYDGDVSYIEWVGPSSVGSTTGNKEKLQIDVTNHQTIYAIVVSFVNSTVPISATATKDGSPKIPSIKMNSIDDLIVTQAEPSTVLRAKIGNERNSSTWNSYKSNTPSENNNDDYEDNTYWHMSDKRYGLEPSHAQINGSFYIDERIGRIHFSSNISGKTVILDYISDSLGTDAEMQVHKFAEDAMYKWIAHAILSTSSYGQGLVNRLTRDKFAAVRKAKLRLSNIKLEELTQILRGKSKHIKH